MLRRLLTVMALCLTIVAPAAAQSICEPGAGRAMTVTGVASNDRLNLRAGAGTRFDVVASVRNGTRLTATGRVRFTEDRCAVSCSRLLSGVPGLERALNTDCLMRGRIWYELRESRTVTGWAAAQFLRAGAAAPPPAGGADVTIRYICRSGERLTVALRNGGREARVTLGSGLRLRLDRRRDTQDFDHFSTEFGGISLRGPRDGVNWIGPGTEKTLCVPTG
jgi:hypothetical protein